jgi:hypothetical protein
MRSRLLHAVVLGAAITLIPGVVIASCAQFPPLEQHIAQADVVFVGTVLSTADEQRTALVEVDEIWHGAELPQQVTVHGAMSSTGFSSIDRTFETGVRYLFATAFANGRLDDNSCTATQPWTDELARLRPTSAIGPTEAPADEVAVLPIVAVLGGLAVILAASVLAFRRGRSP